MKGAGYEKIKEWRGGGNLELALNGLREMPKRLLSSSLSRLGFTLAEVLITLGIIGIVAALTMPSLIANHRKKVTAVRLKQFSSVWQQAYLDVYIENGTENYWGTLVALDSQSALDFYNENFGKFITTTEVRKSKYGIVGAFPSGSGFYFYRWDGSYETSARTYLTFCPYYKDCVELAESASPIEGESIVDGKKSFAFYVTGKTPAYALTGGRDELLEKCSGTAKGYCTTLIEYDGWQISKDYPW